MKELIPNINEARKRNYCFSEYSSTYITTNEDLRTSMKYMPEKCNRALTVAASGDHPLFCSLYGAKHVDTFDISYNAKCIMDIKIAAIGKFKRSDYVVLLENLYRHKDITCVPNINKISNKLSPIEYEYMCSMAGLKLFDYGGWGGEDNPRFPNKQEYQKLRKLVKKPYEFYWTDLANLSTCLVEKYDCIHLSNIFDYIRDRGFQITILERLLKHVNVGGRILIQHMIFDSWTDEHFSKVSAGNFFEKCHFIQAKGNVSVFERIR